MNANVVDGYLDTNGLLKLIDKIENAQAKSVQNTGQAEAEPLVQPQAEPAVQLQAAPPQHAALLPNVGRYVNIWA